SGTSSVGAGAVKGVDAMLPLGLASIAAALRDWSARCGVNLKLQILDMPAAGLTAMQVVEEIDRFDPDIIGMSVLTASASAAAQLTQALKQVKPQRFIVWGGVHATLAGERLLRTTAANAIIAGAGEKSFIRLAEAFLDAGGSEETLCQRLKDVPGASFVTSKDGRQKIVTVSAGNNELDDTLVPAYELFDLEQYCWHGYRTLPLESHRGCRGNCSFCVVPRLSGCEVASRSPGAFINLLSVCSRHGAERAYVVSDNFSGDPGWLSQLCTLVRKQPPEIALEVYCRADDIARNKETARQLKEIGVRTVFVGVESGDAKVLRSYSKNLSLRQIEHAFRTLAGEGLQIIGSFLLGAPDETEESVVASIDFANYLKSIAPFLLHLTFATPYPGTKLRQCFEGEGLALPDEDAPLDPHQAPCWCTKHLSRSRLCELRDEFEHKFYTGEYVARLRCVGVDEGMVRGFARGLTRP
ncbi:MAG TPA: radical SAM protein, partial [Oligoflexia bacterium]|nr:radical SAM protein [Oligoflexia bacterium]